MAETTVIGEVTIQYLSDGTWRFKGQESAQAISTPPVMTEATPVVTKRQEKQDEHDKQVSYIDLFDVGSAVGRTLATVKTTIVLVREQVKYPQELKPEQIDRLVSSAFPKASALIADFYYTNTPSMRSTVTSFLKDENGDKVGVKQLHKLISNYLQEMWDKPKKKAKTKLQLVFEASLDHRGYTNCYTDNRAVRLLFKSDMTLPLVMGKKEV